MKKPGESAPENTPPDLIAAEDMVTLDPSQNAKDNTEITDSSACSSQHVLNVIDSLGHVTDEHTSPSGEKSSLESLFDEFDENDITEIYFGSSETENAVAGLEKCTAEENAANQIQEAEVQNNFQEYKKNPNDYEQLAKQEPESIEYDCNQNENMNFQRKRSVSECDESDVALAKRIKLEPDTDQSEVPCDNAKTAIAVKTEIEHNSHVPKSQTHLSSAFNNIAIDLCPPVAIVTPLSHKNDISKETISIKSVNGTKDTIKTNTNGISESLSDIKPTVKECTKEKSFINEESLFLSDSDFEKFTNDLFSEQSFQTSDGSNWTFQRTDSFAYQSNDQSVNVEKKTLTFEAQLEDFEKILDKFIQSDADRPDTKSAINGRFLGSTVHVTSTTSTAKFKPKLDSISQNVTLPQPDILRNSELLRELLENDTDTSLKSQNSAKRPVSVDLSFLNSDTIYSNRSASSASTILKTKTIDPIPTGELLMISTSDASSKPDSVNFTESLDSESCDTKSADHGPLSLAEQRRASVTLHHKVPNIGDIVSPCGPLSRMNGDETEALLNELTSHTSGNQTGRTSRDILPSGPQDARYEYMNGPRPVTSPFSGFHVENIAHTNGPTNDQELRMKMSMGQRAPGYVAGNRGIVGLSQTEFEAMPAERRHLIASRYGQLMRNITPGGGYPDEMSNPLTRASVNELLTDIRASVNPVNTSMSASGPLMQNHDQFQMNSMRGMPESNGLTSSQMSQPTAETNPYGNEATKDRMRYLMMQQLHRRRMEEQMASRGQAPMDGQCGMIPQGNISRTHPPMPEMLSNATHGTRFPNQHGGLHSNAGHAPFFRPQMDSQAHIPQHNENMMSGMTHGPGANIYQRQLAHQRQQQHHHQQQQHPQQQQQQDHYQHNQHPHQQLYHRNQITQQQQHPRPQHEQQMLQRMNKPHQTLSIDRFSPGHPQQSHQFSANLLNSHLQSRQSQFPMHRMPGSVPSSGMPQMQGPFASMQSHNPHQQQNHHQPHHQQQLQNFQTHSQEQFQFNPLTSGANPYGANAQQIPLTPTTPTLPSGLGTGSSDIKHEPHSTENMSEFFF
ncbi:homeotic protein female sterile-like isoform X2 [Dreissena polymorpha]|nr:homeotic protein female sterile-like isoform X2 [Dreissena polymorpha]XP_052254509.1 homeotic protein female sterile-like isoform X2 [Dreissena polymorpha]